MPARSYKYLNAITVAFVVVILLSNIVASIKITQLELPIFHIKISFAAGLLFFPASYLIGDLLTEVYGYSKSRQVIWSGFISLLIANLIIKFLVILPPDPHWGLQDAYSQIFAIGFRVSIASMLAFFCGEFCNSFVIAKLKVFTKGKGQALRIIGSTCVGEFVDTLLFYPLAFWGDPNFPPGLIAKIMLTNYIVKVLWEICVYPLTRKIIAFLKRTENEDYYDVATDFNPFHVLETKDLQDVK
ncbi:MAG: queuosine precursor transporter [Candidatus Caenarcaniphilales bacterium]|nr:queuosine precursor transporter [Candidatus Caenarcaniphilales bacterium]